MTACALAVQAVAVGGCSSHHDDGAMGPSDGSLFDRPRLAAPLHPDASCPVTIDTPDLLPSSHQPEGSQLTWSSNPPSSGPHYPIWANFQEFDTAVPLGYLVHSMEHGAVVLFYKCDQPCPAVVDGLRHVRDAITTDPTCSPDIRVRVVIAPDPLLDVPVAAAAWGWTYKAQCVDEPTLIQFTRDHYAQSPENSCAAGETF